MLSHSSVVQQANGSAVLHTLVIVYTTHSEKSSSKRRFFWNDLCCERARTDRVVRLVWRKMGAHTTLARPTSTYISHSFALSYLQRFALGDVEARDWRRVGLLFETPLEQSGSENYEEKKNSVLACDSYYFRIYELLAKNFSDSTERHAFDFFLSLSFLICPFQNAIDRWRSGRSGRNVQNKVMRQIFALFSDCLFMENSSRMSHLAKWLMWVRQPHNWWTDLESSYPDPLFSILSVLIWDTSGFLNLFDENKHCSVFGPDILFFQQIIIGC